MAPRFTYFRSDGSSDVRTQRSDPSPRPGEVWVRGAYEGGVLPSPLEVRVGQTGVKVWMAINWLQLADSEIDLVVKTYGHAVTRGDLEGALWFYRQNRDAIDERIREEMAAA